MQASASELVSSSCSPCTADFSLGKEESPHWANHLYCSAHKLMRNMLREGESRVTVRWAHQPAASSFTVQSPAGEGQVEFRLQTNASRKTLLSLQQYKILACLHANFFLECTLNCCACAAQCTFPICLHAGIYYLCGSYVTQPWPIKIGNMPNLEQDQEKMLDRAKELTDISWQEERFV